MNDLGPSPPPIVQTLPYVAWMLLVSLSFGSFAFAVISRQLTDATIGYLRFTAASAALIGLLALFGDPGAPAVPLTALTVHGSTAGIATLRAEALVAFLVLAVVYVMVIRMQAAALIVGALAIGAAVGTLAVAALGWAPTYQEAVPLIVQMAMLAVITGGSLAAVVLGHWYLVTPGISERPLVLQARLLLAILLLQALLFVTWTTLAGGPGQTPFSSFTTGPVLLVVLRLLVTILFPIMLAVMAWRTALTRSMESATGLLYINLAAVMAGTIGAAALYISSGILV